MPPQDGGASRGADDTYPAWPVPREAPHMSLPRRRFAFFFALAGFGVFDREVAELFGEDRPVAWAANEQFAGDRVRQLREAKATGYSQEELAFDTNLDCTSIGNFEQGRSDPHMSTL